MIVCNGENEMNICYAFVLSLVFLSISATGNHGSALADPGKTLQTRSVTDEDGNSYKTVVIGYQEWMTENLRVTRYRDGTPIYYPEEADSLWEADTTGAYAWYRNDEDWAEAYGALYNWHAVNHEAGLCPEGWRVPSLEDRDELTGYLTDHFDHIPLNEVGKALKSCRQVDSPLGGECDTEEHPRWNAHSEHYGTDAFGLSMLPGGMRSDQGSFGFMGRSAYLWTADSYRDDPRAHFFSFSSTNSHMATGISDFAAGYSVRCVRDVEADPPQMGDLAPVSEISATHALAEGEVRDDRGAPVTARGLVWSTQPDPSLDADHYDGMTVEGDGTGIFQSRMYGLSPGTSYHVRAYATNVAGTAYSEPVTFETAAAVVTEPVPPEGSGMETDPYLIASLENLLWISENQDEWDKHYLQTSDIDASPTSGWEDGKGWSPIGISLTQAFTGVYDGGGNHIDHLFINRSDNGQGLFGYIMDGAVIKNLGLRDVLVNGGDWYVGALAGYSGASLVEACFSTGEVTGADTNVGGLVGRNNHIDHEEPGFVKNSYSMCDVSGIDRVGGLVGKNGAAGSDIIHSYSTGRVNGKERYVSPLVGRSLQSDQLPVSNYWNSDNLDMHPQSDRQASAKTTAQLQEFTTFLWWDFKGEDINGKKGVWNIGNDRNGGLPYLSWQYPDDPGITAAFEGGSGTEADPYLIANARQLALINFQFLTAGGASRDDLYFKLAGDIDLNRAPFNQGEGWTPVGTSQQYQVFMPLEKARYFSGTFNGNGYQVHGLTIDRGRSYQGLFGHVHHANIKNVGLRNVMVKGGSRYIGGLLGHGSQTSVKNCFVAGRVGGTGPAFHPATAAYTGGLAGSVTDGSTLADSYTSVEVSGSVNVGGVVGHLEDASIRRTKSTGSVEAAGQCGGFAGMVEEGATISNAYTHSEIIVQEATEDSWIGGFAGANFRGTITNSYATGKITTLRGTSPRNKGFCGQVDSDTPYQMSGNYWDKERSEQQGTAGNASGLSTADMTWPHEGDAFGEWDFEEVWSADTDHEENRGYPYLTQVRPVSAAPPDSQEAEEVAVSARLLPNYPNPFNEATVIPFELPAESEVVIEIFDILGRKVMVLLDETRQAGRHDVRFSASGLSGGVYLVRMQISDLSHTRQTTLHGQSILLMK